MNRRPGTVEVIGLVSVCLRPRDSFTCTRLSSWEGRLRTGLRPKDDFELNIPTDSGFDVPSNEINSDFVWACVD